MASVTKKPISAAILAGGRSSRMGSNKALLELDGKKMIEHVLTTTRKSASEVLLITNTPNEYAFLKLPMYRDKIPDLGPLGGIYTALIECRFTHCLILACDLPFLSEQILQLLSQKIDDYELIALQTKRGIEPLCAVYSKACLPAIERQIEKSLFKITDFYSEVNAHLIQFDLADSSTTHQLHNVNTPQELMQARVLLGKTN